MKSSRWLLLLVFVILLSLLAGCMVSQPSPQSAGPEKQEAAKPADKPVDFFKGKTLNFIVPYSPGGGYDTAVRAIAPFLEKHISGLTAVVKNMPGGGGLVGTNEVYLAKPDGLTIGIAPGAGMVVSQVVGNKAVKYDVKKFVYLQRLYAESRYFLVNPKGSINTLEDLIGRTQPVKQAFTDKGSANYVNAKLFNESLQYTMQEITGYPGRPEMEMALIRGEIDAIFGTETSAIPMIKSGEAKLLFVLNKQMPEDLKEYQGKVPNLMLPEDQKMLSQDGKKWLDVAIDLLGVGRPLIATPETPKERAEILEKAIVTTLQDPEFIADAKKLNVPIDPESGAAIGERISRLTDGLQKVGPQIKAMME